MRTACLFSYEKKTSLSLYYYLFNFVNILYILQNYIVPP